MENCYHVEANQRAAIVAIKPESAESYMIACRPPESVAKWRPNLLFFDLIAETYSPFGFTSPNQFNNQSLLIL